MRLPASHDLAKVAHCSTFTSATTTTGIVIDARGYTYLTLIMGFGTCTGTTPTLLMKCTRDDNSGMSSATDMAGWTTGTIAGVEALDDTTHIIHGPINDTNMERYIRTSITTGATVTSIPVCVIAILSNGPTVPTSANYTTYVTATGT